MKKTSLEKFTKLEAKIEGIEDTIEKYSKISVDTLKTKPQWERNRLRGRRYNAGWTYGISVDNTEIAGLVRNETDWQLTWLLENGHLVTNKKGGVGWASPHRHIRPVFEDNVKDYVDDMKRLEVDIKIK